MLVTYLICAENMITVKPVTVDDSKEEKLVCLKQVLIISFPSFPSPVRVPQEPSRRREPSLREFPFAACHASYDDPCGAPSSGAPSGCGDPSLRSFRDRENPQSQLGSRKGNNGTVAKDGLLTLGLRLRVANC